MASSYSRRSFISRFALFGCMLPLTAYAHRFQSRSARRIGFLIGAGFPSLIAAFEDELRKLGYVDAQDLVIEKRISRSASEAIAMAAELAKMDLDLIVAASLAQALELRKNNPAMPMVIGTCPAMVSNGFARSLERPGGHYTGMDELPPDVTAAGLNLDLPRRLVEKADKILPIAVLQR